MKPVALLLAMIIMCLLPSSCSNSDTPAAIDVSGSWTMTERSTDEGKTWQSWTLVPTVAVFHPDGRFYTDGYFGEHNGRWTRAGNQVTATMTDGSQILYRFDTQSDNTAQIRITTLYGALWVRAVKE